MIEKIEAAVQTYPITRVPQQNNCGRINRSLQLAITEDTKYNAEMCVGYIKKENKKSDSHYFLHVEDEIIVDGAAQQFVGDIISRSSFDRVNLVCDKIIVDYETNIPFKYNDKFKSI